MKVLAVALLASYALAHQSHSDYHQFKTWAEAKAMESCWGEENNKLYVVSMKKAVAKCKQQDAPELELPPYRSSYKFVNVLTGAADSMDHSKMAQMFNFMRSFHENQHEENERFSSHNQYDMMKKLMLKYQMKQMMEDYMTADSYKKDDNDMPYSGKFDHQDHKSKARFNLGMFRNGRDAGDVVKNIELGDKLVAKLNAQKESMVAEIGNMTCVLQECGMLNAENQLDVRSMKQKLSAYTLPSKWFKTKFEELIDNCYEMATTLPASVEEENVVSGNFGEVNVGQIKHFLKCYKDYHRKICMDQDTKTNIEENYGPVADILDQTGLTEHQLFTAFQHLITGEESEYLGY